MASYASSGRIPATRLQKSGAMVLRVPTDDELFDVIAKEALVDRATLKRDAALEDLGIASLDVISVLFEVEDKFGIVVDESELGDCKTLGQLMDKLKARAEAPA